MFEEEFYPALVPEDSYSRQLDHRAQMDTPPYGYATDYYMPPMEIEKEVKKPKLENRWK